MAEMQQAGKWEVVGSVLKGEFYIHFTDEHGDNAWGPLDEQDSTEIVAALNALEAKAKAADEYIRAQANGEYIGSPYYASKAAQELLAAGGQQR